MSMTIVFTLVLLGISFGFLLVFAGLYISMTDTSMTDTREDPEVINEFRSYGVQNHRHGRILRPGKIIGGYRED